MSVAAVKNEKYLWQFLVQLLNDPNNEFIIKWTNYSKYEFKLIQPDQVARLWGQTKNRPSMNYAKLARSLRYYYAKRILTKIPSKRHYYMFVDTPALRSFITLSMKYTTGKSVKIEPQQVDCSRIYDWSSNNQHQQYDSNSYIYQHYSQYCQPRQSLSPGVQSQMSTSCELSYSSSTSSELNPWASPSNYKFYSIQETSSTSASDRYQFNSNFD